MDCREKKLAIRKGGPITINSHVVACLRSSVFVNPTWKFLSAHSSYVDKLELKRLANWPLIKKRYFAVVPAVEVEQADEVRDQLAAQP